MVSRASLRKGPLHRGLEEKCQVHGGWQKWGSEATTSCINVFEELGVFDRLA